MRISSSTIFDMGVAAVQQQQTDLLKTQQQVATGRRVLSPADDPSASARALDLSQSLATTEQYASNIKSAQNSLGQEDAILGSVTTLLQDVRVTALNAGNPVLGNSDRASLVAELQSKFRELMGLANSTDGTGQYLFSGFQGANQPYSQTSTGATYLGDQGQRLIQISPSRQIAVSDSGADIFEAVKTGNGTFVTSAAGGNTGSGVISTGSVSNATDPNLLTTVTLTFNNPATTFNVAGAVPAVGAPVAYTSGNAITYNGRTVDITGTPQPGDVFTIQASGNQSIFTTLTNLINQVTTPISAGASNATLTNGLNTSIQQLDNALGNVLRVRAGVGARLNEIDSAQSTGEGLTLQYKQTLSSLQDLDYASAVSQLNQQQVYLEAAQKSFLKVSGLSLFNYV